MNKKFNLCWHTREKFLEILKNKITSVWLEYGSLSLVSTKSFYKHFPLENNKKSKMYQSHSIFDMIG